jgi:hypothetical protein
MFQILLLDGIHHVDYRHHVLDAKGDSATGGETMSAAAKRLGDAMDRIAFIGTEFHIHLAVRELHEEGIRVVFLAI